MLQLVIHLEHLIVCVVHVYAQTVKHLVLLGHFSIKVLVFIFDVLDYTPELIQGNILVFYHFPLLFQQLLRAHVLGMGKLSILIP